MNSAQSSWAHNYGSGLLGEQEIARWLIACGATVLPAYEIEYQKGKGPRIFRKDGPLVAPDMLVVKDPSDIVWVEAKTKGGWAWYQKGQCWHDGIDRNHWNDYIEVAASLPWKVMLLFLHRTDEPAPYQDKYAPPPGERPPPAGLYGNNISNLVDCNPQDSDKHGRNGMVYWTPKQLPFIAPYPLPNSRTLSEF